jgi:hypothetical protein
MSIDDAIKQIQLTVKATSAGTEIKVVKISEEEARISVYAAAEDILAIKDATFQPVLDLLTKGLDVQVFVYDKDNPVATA